MPYGFSLTKYIAVVTTAFLSMLAGAQWVHEKYRPLDDLEELIEIEMKKHSAQ